MNAAGPQRNKLILVAVLFAGAAAIWFATRGEGDHLDDPAFKTVWKCAACGHIFDLLPGEREEALKLDGAPPILCPACQKQEAYQAIGCPVCQTLYFGAEVPGSTGFCPVCHPNKPRPEAPEMTDEGPKRRSVPRN